MQDESGHAPLGAELAPPAVPNEYDSRIVGRYDSERQLVAWNESFDDPNLGAPLCTTVKNNGYTYCRVPGETNCSLTGLLIQNKGYQCDYDGG